MFNNLDKTVNQLNRFSKAKDKDSKYAKILISNYPILTKNVNSIIECIKHLSKQAAAQLNEVDPRNKPLPYARYQQLMRFIRVCAYESMGLKRDNKEEQNLLNTVEKEFNEFRNKFKNQKYIKSQVREYMRVTIDSFLQGKPLDIVQIFKIFGM